MLDPRRHDHLADLALVGEILADQQVLDDLLGDGRAALRPPGVGEVADEGADQATLVDPLVLLKKRLSSAATKALRTCSGMSASDDPDAPLVLLEHFREALALAVEHDAGARQLQALELGVIGQVGDRLVVEIDHVAEIDRRRRDLLVLAELPVGGEQVGEIDAAERLALAGDRLRIVHGGGDEVVEVDVLDVERLAHMGAARAQEARDLLLVAARGRTGSSPRPARS